MLGSFPTIYYKFDKETTKRIVNFTIAILVENMSIKNKLLFKEVAVNETETPESISYLFYDTPEYWWTILLVNNMYNPFDHWVKSNWRITKETKGHNDILFFKDIRTNVIADDLDDIKYREMMDNDIILPEYINAIRRSDYEYEKNEKRYKIWIISPDYIHKFVDAYLEQINKDFD